MTALVRVYLSRCSGVRQMLKVPDVFLVVFLGPADNLFGFCSPVQVDEHHSPGVLSRYVLVGREIMYQPSDDVFGELVDVGVVAIYGIVAQYGYDLVIGLVVVEESQPSDRVGPDDDVAVCHILFREDTDVKRVSVSLDIISGQYLVGHFGHSGIAVCARQESVERRDYVGELLRPVKGQVT